MAYSNYFTCPECGIEFEVSAELMLGRPNAPLSMSCPPCLMPSTLKWIKQEVHPSHIIDPIDRCCNRCCIQANAPAIGSACQM